MADWDDLRVFLAVARYESLSGAGRTLRIDPATVGRRIARFEEALSARLFAKSPQGYVLTDEGSRLVPHAEAAELAMVAPCSSSVAATIASSAASAWGTSRDPSSVST